MATNNRRNARIVCTLGPASGDKKTIAALIAGGMDVARLNFSHGDHASHERLFRLVREISSMAGKPVAILQDLQGIKIRTGPAKGGEVFLEKGREVLIRPGNAEGDEGTIYVSYPGIIRHATRGDRVLVDDGLIELNVTGRRRGALVARVVEGGRLGDRKGVNLPCMKIDVPSFTPKDRRDLALGLRLGVDFVAISFVREAEDIRKVRRFITKNGLLVPLIAKVEKPEAMENLESILKEADGVMVARGDLGVEVPAEDVPIIQKRLIDSANRSGKLVITATQMLESMTVHRRPTRAEATDVANAVIDGSDALMLSAETSTGSHPLLALRMMDRIIRKTEAEIKTPTSYLSGETYSEAVAMSAASAAEDIGADYVVAFTQSGYTARLLSKYRPSVPILAFTPSEDVQRRMSLYWGVRSMTMRPLENIEEVFAEVERSLIAHRLTKPGRSVVITASSPVGGEGKTNLMKLHRMGDSGKVK